jgi:hypothetical protein
MAPRRHMTIISALMFRHPEEDDTDTGNGDAGAGDLGDAGKRALDEERRARRAAEKAAKERDDELAKIRAELDDARKKNLTDEERRVSEAVEAAKAETAKELTEKHAAELSAAGRRLVGARLQAVAAGKVINPADTALYIDLDTLERDASGDVPDAALAAAVDALVKERPYLAARAGKGSADQGRQSDSAPNFRDRSQLADGLAQFGLKPRS